MSAVTKTWVHKQSSPYHYQEHESWANKRRLKTVNTKAWYELCQEERQASFEPAHKSHISSIMFLWKDQICIWSTDNFESPGGKKAFFVQSQASGNLAAVITDTASPSHLLWHL